MIRIAFVVQRYGLEVAGGAELMCRWLAEHLTKYFEVHVLTTCARNHLPWDNYYPEGEERLNGVIVHRSLVDRKRDHLAFDTLTGKIFGEAHTYLDEIEWLKMLGPYSSGLLKHIASSRSEYDLLIFSTYQYFHTVFGLPLVPEKALLIPNAHDDRGIYLDIYNHVFHLPRFILYNTDTERDMVHWRFGNSTVPHAVVGTGIEVPSTIDPERFKQRHGLESPFILYSGRVEPAKGCATLLEHFVRYKDEHGGDVKLVLIGKVEMPLPERDDVLSLGFVSEQEKFDGVAASTVVVLPSEYESLSMINLEAWLMGVPVLANGFCQVLKDNCLKSNGGLYYTSYDEFAACLNLLVADQNLRRVLGENGRQYCQENYSWDVVERKYLEIILGMTG